MAVIIPLAFFILWIAGLWKIFEKAGQPGWAAIIPIYNLYIITKIAGKEWWWLLLLLIPIVNIVIVIILYVAVVREVRQGRRFCGRLGVPPVHLRIDPRIRRCRVQGDHGLITR